ncbi:UNVERIFIED_CONTAM: hypothetical protein NCL1_54016 [Trichonephila clavipes]
MELKAKNKKSLNLRIHLRYQNYRTQSQHIPAPESSERLFLEKYKLTFNFRVQAIWVRISSFCISCTI